MKLTTIWFSHFIIELHRLLYFIVKLNISNESAGRVIAVPGGCKTGNEQLKRFVENEYHKRKLADIIQSYAIGDTCLIGWCGIASAWTKQIYCTQYSFIIMWYVNNVVGPKGSGKSMLVFEIARLLNQTCEPMVLYQDMTARDFIQQRTTTVDGDTIWRDSPLITAAKRGHIAILDGIHRIHSSTISILHRLDGLDSNALPFQLVGSMFSPPLNRILIYL